ncbi:helicostatins-like [Limulus polyphemus]|uniref:Helicostatins-like n=1 Tax=Limulus polyphemus TaxID=6850 RepID=A0ABM1T6Q6_LIMPO|nr:helicostatins-like [Limulus polyphemus]
MLSSVVTSMFLGMSKGIVFTCVFFWMTGSIGIAFGEEGEVFTEKRNHDLYRFGLGKRREQHTGDDLQAKRADPVYDFGLGKRNVFFYPDEPLSEDENLFLKYNDFSQQLEPLISNYKNKHGFIYDYGLNKRDAEKDRFSSGLGKRNENSFNLGLGKRIFLDSFLPQEYEDFIKRRFHFGLGKRVNREYNFGLGRKKREIDLFL